MEWMTTWHEQNRNSTNIGRWLVGLRNPIRFLSRPNLSISFSIPINNWSSLGFFLVGGEILEFHLLMRSVVSAFQDADLTIIYKLEVESPPPSACNLKTKMCLVYPGSQQTSWGLISIMSSSSDLMRYLPSTYRKSFVAMQRVKSGSVKLYSYQSVWRTLESKTVSIFCRSMTDELKVPSLSMASLKAWVVLKFYRPCNSLDVHFSSSASNQDPRVVN